MRFISKAIFLFLLTSASSTSISHADIIFNFGTPSPSGVVSLEIIGTGTSTGTAAGFAGDLTVGTSNFGFNLDLLGAISLGGQSGDTIAAIGDSTSGFFSFNFDGDIPNGTPLSSLDGTYSISLSGGDFPDEQIVYESPFAGSAGAGTITFNFDAVPEPASGGILLFMLGAQALTRRRRHV